jgi:hypothetical protein
MRTKLACAILAGMLLVSPAVLAQEEEQAPTPESEAMAGIDRLMRALELLLQSIPQFEAPYMNDEGDIVIPRKRVPADEPPEEAPEHGPEKEDQSDSTAT